nr:hypothetical protein Ade03nite_20590 [Actinoplanes derwentensis]
MAAGRLVDFVPAEGATVLGETTAEPAAGFEGIPAGRGLLVGEDEACGRAGGVTIRDGTADGEVAGDGAAGWIGCGAGVLERRAKPRATMAIAAPATAGSQRRDGNKNANDRVCRAAVGGASNRSRSAVICPARAAKALRSRRSISSVTAPPVVPAGSPAPDAPSI